MGGEESAILQGLLQFNFLGVWGRYPHVRQVDKEKLQHLSSSVILSSWEDPLLELPCSFSWILQIYRHHQHRMTLGQTPDLFEP